MPKREIIDQNQIAEDEIDLSSLFQREEVPDFKKDPVGVIKEWMEKYLPEVLQKKFFNYISSFTEGPMDREM